MARIKIQRSERQTAPYKATPLGGAAIPALQIGAMVESGITGLFKPVEDAKKVNKKIEDRNELHDLRIKELPIITDEYNKYNFSTKKDDADIFLNSLNLKNFEDLVKNSNKEVKAGFNNFLQDQQIKLYPKLKGQIALRHVQKTYAVDDEELNGFVLDAASPNPNLNYIGNTKLEGWFNDPSNSSRYLPKAFADLKKAKLKLAREYQVMFDAEDTGGLPTLENKQEIIAEFGPVKGEKILEDIRTKFISKQIQKDLDEETLEKQNNDQQIENFASVLNNINNYKITGDSSNLHSLDDITDLFKAGEINSAQYKTLLDFYSTGEKISDNRLIDEINYQIAIAESVEDLDAINNQLNFSMEFAKGLGVKDITNFSKVFNRLRKDSNIFQDYKYYKTQINTVLGKADGFRSKWSSAEANEKLVRIDAVNEYNRLVGDGVRVDDAFNKIIKQFANKDNIPTIFQMTQPTTVSSIDYRETIKREGAGGFDKIRSSISELYGEGKIDMKAFMLDMDRMDMIEDLYEMRKSIPEMGSNFALSENNSGKQGTD